MPSKVVKDEIDRLIVAVRHDGRVPLERRMVDVLQRNFLRGAPAKLDRELIGGSHISDDDDGIVCGVRLD